MLQVGTLWPALDNFIPGGIILHAMMRILYNLIYLHTEQQVSLE